MAEEERIRISTVVPPDLSPQKLADVAHCGRTLDEMSSLSPEDFLEHLREVSGKPEAAGGLQFIIREVVDFLHPICMALADGMARGAEKALNPGPNPEDN